MLGCAQPATNEGDHDGGVHDARGVDEGNASVNSDLAACPEFDAPAYPQLGHTSDVREETTAVVVGVTATRLDYIFEGVEHSFHFEGGDLSEIFAVGEDISIGPHAAVGERGVAEYGSAETEPIDGGSSSVELVNTGATVQLLPASEIVECLSHGECGPSARTERTHRLQVGVGGFTVHLGTGETASLGGFTFRNVHAVSSRTVLLDNQHGCSEEDWDESSFLVMGWGSFSGR